LFPNWIQPTGDKTIGKQHEHCFNASYNILTETLQKHYSNKIRKAHNNSCDMGVLRLFKLKKYSYLFILKSILFMKTSKIFIVMLVLVAITITTITAKAKEPAVQAVQAEPAKEKIKKEELPAAAIKTLDGDAFKGWTVVQAYRVKSKDAQGKEVVEYQVDVKKDNLTQTVKFDKEGNSK
jgi:hypothetical protein